jgi:tetratricopeptide (TPR) repeat protein
LGSGDVAAALTLPTTLRYFWRVRGYHSEGRERLLRILSQPAAAGRITARARALNAAGYLQSIQGNHREAHELLAEALSIGRELADRPSIAFALRYLGTVAYARHDFLAASTYGEESLAIYRELGTNNDIGLSLMYLGDAILGLRDYGRAQILYQESVNLMRQENNRVALPYPLRRLGHLALLEGATEQTIALCMESLTLNMKVGEQQGSAACLVGLAVIAERSGHVDWATRLLGAADALVESIHTQLLPFDREQSSSALDRARAQLDPAAFAALWAEGRTLTLEQAVGAMRKMAMSTSVQLPHPDDNDRGWNADSRRVRGNLR